MIVSPGASGVPGIIFSTLIFFSDMLRVKADMSLYQSQMKNLGEEKLLQGPPWHLY